MLKPVAKQVVVSLKEPALLVTSQTTVQGIAGSTTGDLGAALGEGSAAAFENPQDAALRRRMAESKTAVFDQVAEHIRKSPAQSTRLLEAWISAEGD